ncbi:MAG: F0F1 ATP synthase subunit B [Patescibacteria group bacterium]|nr:F0F1 ATP synthase subunit B [Patescibacteria group bacterium]
MELIEKLGIDWRLIIAQIINFGILLFVLYRYAYKPILRMLNKRTETIAKSLTDAKQIEENLAISNSKKDEILREARKQAQRILEEVTLRGENMRQEKLQAANKEVEEIVRRTKEELAKAKVALVKEVRAEVADLVVQAAEKVLKERLDEKKDRELIESALAEVMKNRA